MRAAAALAACLALGACRTAMADAVTTCSPQKLTGCAKGLKCVKKDETYAQCVDCAPDAFQASCVYFDEVLANAAEMKCGMNCMGRPDIHQCKPDTLEGCPAGLECARKDDHWAQCVNCTASQYSKDCPYYWHKGLTAAAAMACNSTCFGARGSQCISIPCGPELACVKSSETWAQCVSCDTKAFQDDCGYWSGEFLEAAEKSCKAKCAAKRRLLL